MEYIRMVLVLAIAYVLGSIPFGLLIVRLRTGKDIRQVESGRTGGTNVMRAAGFWAGLATAILDMGKSAIAVVIARRFLPGNSWFEVFAPVMAIVGHNYSLFLADRNERGQLRLRGGAGGAPCTGGSVGLWFPSIFILMPLGMLLLYFVGYASLATLSAAIFSIVLFGVRAWLGLGPWEYTLYGVFSLILLAWSLRGNIKRLINGDERLVGLRAQRRRVDVTS